MVDVLYVIFVIALEAGLFVLPCSVHVISLFSAQVLDQVRAWVQQRWRHEVLQFARQLQEWTGQESRQQETVRDPMLLLGKRLLSSPFVLALLPHPVRGGRSFAGVPVPTGANPIPIRVVLPARASWRGCGAKRKTEDREAIRACAVESCRFFVSFADCIVGAWLKTAGSSTSSCAASTRVLARMSSTAPVQKVGQALAKDLWKEHREEHEV